jgi:hypothetical protein
MMGIFVLLSKIFCLFSFTNFLFIQDFTGVPAVVDLACMRDAMSKLGSDPNKINPLVSLQTSSYINYALVYITFLAIYLICVVDVLCW